MSAATLSLRMTPSTNGKWATGLICCIATTMKHPLCKASQRGHHSPWRRDDIRWSPAGSKNLFTRPLPLERGLFGTTLVYQHLPGLDLVCPESPYRCLTCDRTKIAALQQHYHADRVDE